MDNFFNGEKDFLKILNRYEQYSKGSNDGTYVFLYVISGNATVVINGELIQAGEFDYLMLRGKDSFVLKEIGIGGSVLILSVLESRILPLFTLWGDWFYEKSSEEDVLFVSGDYNVKMKADELIERLKKTGNNDNIISRLLIVEFVSGIIRKMYRKQHYDEIPTFLVEAMRALREPENLKLGVAAIEKYTHYSHAQICRLVKKYYNVTPQEYITNLRLSFAYNMIVYSNISMSNIANDVGYRSLSNFYCQFKSKYHMLPSKLREKNSGKRKNKV